MISEATASVFILHRDRERGWLVALVWHPRLECWLPAGGHVEANETAAQAGVREALEETGLDVTLAPGPAVPFPAGFPHQLVTAPWLTAEVPASPDRHTSERHLHVDHVYAATAVSPRPGREPEHQVRWFSPADLAATPAVSEDSRILAGRLLTLAAPQPGPGFQWPAGTGTGQRAGVTAATGASPLPGRDSASTRLIVIRGNSASGKSAVAAAIRARYGRGLAIVSQDNLRRVVLRERDVPGGANVGLIDLTARHALSCGFHVVVEGILRADHYGDMLTTLISDHAGSASAYFFDVPFEETLRRHATKAEALKYGEAEMRQWWRGLDLLPGGIEQVIPADSALDDTVTRLMADARLVCDAQFPRAGA
jgi:8-oxo-dGTP pyrophosphatase MutT (NUDIX family)